MIFDLTKLHIKALERLRSECSYSDHHKAPELRFIARGHLECGVKTLGDLVSMGLATTGKCYLDDTLGYRITPQGLDELNSISPK